MHEFVKDKIQNPNSKNLSELTNDITTMNEQYKSILNNLEKITECLAIGTSQSLTNQKEIQILTKSINFLSEALTPKKTQEELTELESSYLI